MRTIISYLYVYIFNNIGIRKYVIKKIIYNICNTTSKGKFNLCNAYNTI